MVGVGYWWYGKWLGWGIGGVGGVCMTGWGGKWLVWVVIDPLTFKESERTTGFSPIK